MTTEKKCYCGSGRLFVDCCGPVVAGSFPAATAEALMRSRYTANVLKDTVYLLKSWHPSTRPQSMDVGSIPAWCGLTVLSTRQEQEGTCQWIVEFRALYKTGSGVDVLQERSRFIFENNRWYYLDGDIRASGGPQSGKTGRNAACPCGSGKKHKKCCLK